MDTGALDWALSKGVPGVLALVVLAQVYVIRHLWMKINDLQSEKDKIQEERLTDAQKNTAALLEVTLKTNVAIHSLEQASENFESLLNGLATGRKPKQ